MTNLLTEEIMLRLYENEMGKIITECQENGIDLDQLTEQELNELFGGIRQRFGNLMRGQGFKTDKDALHNFRMKHDTTYQKQQAAQKHKNIEDRLKAKGFKPTKFAGRLPIKNASGLVTGRLSKSQTNRRASPYSDSDRAARVWDTLRRGQGAKRDVSKTAEVGNRLNATLKNGYVTPKQKRLNAEAAAAKKPLNKNPINSRTVNRSGSKVNTGGRKSKPAAAANAFGAGVNEHFIDRVGIKLVEMRLGEKKVNPWAVCHSSTGPKKTSKFERCVMDVKKKQDTES